MGWKQAGPFLCVYSLKKSCNACKEIKVEHDNDIFYLNSQTDQNNILQRFSDPMAMVEVITSITVSYFCNISSKKVLSTEHLQNEWLIAYSKMSPAYTKHIHHFAHCFLHCFRNGLHLSITWQMRSFQGDLLQKCHLRRLK